MCYFKSSVIPGAAFRHDSPKSFCLNRGKLIDMLERALNHHLQNAKKEYLLEEWQPRDTQ